MSASVRVEVTQGLAFKYVGGYLYRPIPNDVYVLDPTVPEGRTWDNAGVTEDVATGSAAGPTGWPAH